MVKMISGMAYLMALFGGTAPADATDLRRLACEKFVLSKSNVDVAADLELTSIAEVVLPGMKWSPGDFTFRPDRDEREPRLLVLERWGDQRQHPHETLSARTYARFVRERQGLNFIFLNQYAGRSVPVFDGLLVRDDGMPTANVSLKFASLRVQVVKLKSLLESVEARLNFEREDRILRSPLNWFRANAHVELIEGRVYNKNYQREIRWSAKMAALFNLFRPDGHPYGREFRTVVDMRDSGYPFAFFKEAGTLEAIAGLVRARAGNVGLTFLWDERRAVEFRFDASKIYE